MSIEARCFAPSKSTCITFNSCRLHQTCSPSFVHPTSSCEYSRGLAPRGTSSKHFEQWKNNPISFVTGIFFIALSLLSFLLSIPNDLDRRRRYTVEPLNKQCLGISYRP